MFDDICNTKFTPALAFYQSKNDLIWNIHPNSPQDNTNT